MENKIVGLDPRRAWIEVRINGEIRRYVRGERILEPRRNEFIDVLWKEDVLREEERHKAPILLLHGTGLKEHPGKLVVEEPCDEERQGGSRHYFYVLQ